MSDAEEFCAREGCEQHASTLQCPTCIELGGEREKSIFCSQDCLTKGWTEHKVYHNESQRKSQKRFTQALESVDSGDPQAALKQFTAAIKYTPAEPGLYYARSRILEDVGLPLKALEDLDKAVELHVASGRGEDGEHDDDDDEEELDEEEAAARNDWRYETCNLLDARARVLIEQVAARQDHKPREGEPAEELTRALADLDRVDGIIKSLAEVTYADDEDYARQAFYLRGEALFLCGRPAEAADAFKRSLGMQALSRAFVCGKLNQCFIALEDWPSVVKYCELGMQKSKGKDEEHKVRLRQMLQVARRMVELKKSDPAAYQRDMQKYFVDGGNNACHQCQKTSGDAALLLCGGCGKASYCDAECQKAAWKAHKQVCAGRKEKANENTENEKAVA